MTKHLPFAVQSTLKPCIAPKQSYDFITSFQDIDTARRLMASVQNKVKHLHIWSYCSIFCCLGREDKNRSPMLFCVLLAAGVPFCSCHYSFVEGQGNQPPVLWLTDIPCLCGGRRYPKASHSLVIHQLQVIPTVQATPAGQSHLWQQQPTVWFPLEEKESLPLTHNRCRRLPRHALGIQAT